VICLRCNRESIPDSDYTPSVTVPGVCWSCLTHTELGIESIAIEAGTCPVCGGYREGNTCCPDDVPDREDSYRIVVAHDRPSCALSLLALWDRPWSANAMRWANHVLTRAHNAGLIVLDC